MDVTELDVNKKDVKKAVIDEVVDFDEALAKLGFGKFNYFLIVIAGVIITATSFETLGISFVFPVAECDLELTTKHKGVLSAAASVGIIVSSHFWGFLADTKGRKAVILPTLVLSFLFSLLSSLATSFIMLLVFRFFSGFFIAGSSATIFAYLGEFHSSRNRSKVLMAASFVYGVCCNYMPLLGFGILNQSFHFTIPLLNIVYKPWRLYLVACGLPSLLCAFAMFFLPESPKFTFSMGNEEGTLKILQKIHKINNPNDKESYKVVKLVEDIEFLDDESRLSVVTGSTNPIVQLWRQTCLLFNRKHIRKTVLICLMQCGLYGSCHGLYMFFPEIVDNLTIFSKEFPAGRATICEILHIEDELSNNATSLILLERPVCLEQLEISTFGHSVVLEILYMFGFLIITLVINRTSKLSILLVILFGCALSGFATHFVTIPLLSVYIYVMFMLTFLGVNVINAATVDLFPTNLRGMAINLAVMFGRIGSVLGTGIVGFTLDNYCSETFSVSAIIMVCCGILAFFIPKISKIDGRKSDVK